MLVVILKNYDAITIEEFEYLTVVERDGLFAELHIYGAGDTLISVFHGEDIVGFFPTFHTKDGREVVYIKQGG